MCRAEYIEVTVESKNYPGLDTNVTHLEDEACGAFFRDDSKAVFRFGLEECKTKQEDDGKAIHYRNRICSGRGRGGRGAHHSEKYKNSALPMFL